MVSIIILVNFQFTIVVTVCIPLLIKKLWNSTQCRCIHYLLNPINFHHIPLLSDPKNSPSRRQASSQSLKCGNTLLSQLFLCHFTRGSCLDMILAASPPHASHRSRVSQFTKCAQPLSLSSSSQLRPPMRTQNDNADRASEPPETKGWFSVRCRRKTGIEGLRVGQYKNHQTLLQFHPGLPGVEYQLQAGGIPIS